MLPKEFVVVDPRFKALIFGNSQLDKLYTGTRWAEGPAYFPAGKYLIWSDIPNNRLMRYDETDGSVSVYDHDSRNQNGHTVDREGRLIACEHRGRCVSRIEHDGSRTILADKYEGKRLNSPNDAVVKSDGCAAETADRKSEFGPKAAARMAALDGSQRSWTFFAAMSARARRGRRAGAMSRCTRSCSAALHTPGREVFALTRICSAMSASAARST